MKDLQEMNRITVREAAQGRILEIHLTGKLDKEDYQHLVPVVEKNVQEHGKLRLLVEMHDFHGWTLGGIWQDIRFDAKHFNDIERIAMVGEQKWQERMSVFCNPFTTAKIRYFDHSAMEEAKAWLAEE